MPVPAPVLGSIMPQNPFNGIERLVLVDEVVKEGYSFDPNPFNGIERLGPINMTQRLGAIPRIHSMELKESGVQYDEYMAERL